MRIRSFSSTRAAADDLDGRRISAASVEVTLFVEDGGAEPEQIRVVYSIDPSCLVVEEFADEDEDDDELSGVSLEFAVLRQSEIQ